MKKFVKRVSKCIIIYVVTFMTVLSSISYGYTSEEVGDAVAGFAKHVVDDYGEHVGYRQIVGDSFDGPHKKGVSGHSRYDNPIWSPESYSWDDEWIYFDCTSFACGCYHYVTGLISQPYATGELSGTPGEMQNTFEKIHWDKQESSLQVGDLLYYHIGDTNGHGWIYSGDGQTSENGSKHYSWDTYNGKDVYIYRVTDEAAKNLTNLNTEFASGKIKSGGGATGTSVNYSNFYFNGIPDGKYSIASRKSVFTMIVETLSSLADFLTGLITYLFRGVIISFISVFDRLINNTVAAMNGKQKSLKEAGISANDADDPMKISRYVTIEGLIFGDSKMDLFDIDIFK